MTVAAACCPARLALVKAATSINGVVEAFSEQLITIDELHAKLPAPAHSRSQPAQPTRRLRIAPTSAGQLVRRGLS